MKRKLIAIAVGTFLLTHADAQQPLTGMMQVNTSATSSTMISCYDVGIFPNGSFVPVWRTTPAGTPVNHSNFMVFRTYYRQYDAANTPLTSTDNMVYSGTLDYDGDDFCSIDVKASGEFIIAYSESVGSIANFSLDHKIYYQKYSSTGAAVGARVFVANGIFPRISIAPDGTFNIAYQQNNTYGATCPGCSHTWIMVKRYNASGTTVGSPIYAIDFALASSGYNNDIKSLNNNAFYVNAGTIFRRFNSAGVAVYGDLNFGYTLGANGTWAENFVVKPNGDIVSIENTAAAGGCRISRWLANGNTPYNTELLVTPNYSGMSAYRPSIGINSKGDYVVIYPKFDNVGNDLGLYAQQYCINDTKVGPEYSIDHGLSPAPSGNVRFASIAVSDCEFVITCGRTMNSGLYARKFKLYPTINITQPAPICRGTSVSLSNTNCSSGTYTYAWTPSTGLSSLTVLNPVVTPTSTTTYSLQVTGNGCTSSIPVTVNVLPAPTADAGPDQTICLDDCTWIGVLIPQRGCTYNWTAGGGTIATTQETAVCPTTTTTYIQTVTNASGCTASDQVTITVVPDVTPTLTGPELLCAPAPLTFTGGNTGPDNMTNHFWGIGEFDYTLWQDVPGGFTWSNWYPGNPGTFTFPVTVECDKYYHIKVATFSCDGWEEANLVIYYACCENRFMVVESNETVKNTMKTEMQVNIYPNPSAGIFNVEMDEANGKMQVYDAMGKNIRSIDLNGNTRYILDLTGYSKGIYTVNVLTEKGSRSQKIVLE